MNRLERAMAAKPLRFTSLLVCAINTRLKLAKTMADFVKINEDFAGGVQRQARAISQLRPGANRARSVHKMLDAASRRSDKLYPHRNDKITCRKGCAHCCHMFVTCTNDELALLVEVIEEKKLVLNEELLRAQQGHDEDGYVRIGYERARCVFLGPDNACQIYEDRPSSCRNLRVSSPAEMCLPTLDATAGIAVEMTIAAEMISSGAMNLDGDEDDNKIASVATKLWRHLGHAVTNRVHAKAQEGLRQTGPAGSR